VKILKNSSINKIVFRCDAGNNPKVGTGHLYRCIHIAEHLVRKYKINKKQIIFICKKGREFSISKKILYNQNYKTIEIGNNIIDNSIKEAKFISSANGNLLIIDRIGTTNEKFYNILKTKFNKIILFEDKSKIRNKFDLSINSLVFPKLHLKSKNVKVGFKFLLLPSILENKVANSLSNNIFLSFGGYDHNNLCLKVLKILHKINKNLKIFIPKIYELNLQGLSKKHKIVLYSKNDYMEHFRKCNIAIISGGLTLFDGIYLKKKIICIPQYRHQLFNADKIKKSFPLFVIKRSLKSFNTKILNKFNEIYDNKKLDKEIKLKKNNIISKKNYIKTMKYLEKMYEKSLN